MTLQELIETLPPSRQLAVAIHFAELALPIWEEYAATPGNLMYIDTVVGMDHAVAPELLVQVNALAKKILKMADASPDAEQKAEVAVLHHAFIDPIVALQDDDWSIPESVRLVFYAHHNIVEHLRGEVASIFGEKTLYVATNQAIDALESSGRMTFAEIRKQLHPMTGGRAPQEGIN